MTVADLTRAKPFGVPRGDIIGPRRTERVVRARDAVAWAANKGLKRTMPQIGMALGRNPSSISDAVARAERRRQVDEHFRAVSDFLAELSS